MIEGARKMKNLQNELQCSIVPPPALKCPQHERSEIKFACTTCNILVCVECTAIKHKGHDFEELMKHATQQKQKITEGKELLVQAEIKLGESIEEVKTVMEKVEEKRKEIDAKINDEFRRFEAALKSRKRELIAKSKEISTAKLTGLSIQVDEMYSLKDQITSCNSVVGDISANFSDAEILAIITPLLAQLNQLLERFKKQTLEPTECDTLIAEIDSSKVQSAIATFGAVSETPTPTPRDYTSLKMPSLTMSAACPYDIAVCSGGDVIVANHSGHSVEVFDAAGKQKRTFGLRGSGDGQFYCPIGICEHEGIVFVGDHGGNRIQKMTKEGEFLSKFGSKGSQNGQLSQPWGCTVDKHGRVYIAEVGNNRVQVFNPDGTFSRIIGGDGSTPAPRAVALDPDNNIHVATYNASVVKVFSTSGRLVREYGNGILSGPSGVAVDKFGYCIVGDWSNRAVHIFDPYGHHIHRISLSSCVCGIAIDNEGFVYAVEGRKQIHKF
jgi:DNA-binding beta-propeller fold protein YncE